MTARLRLRRPVVDMGWWPGVRAVSLALLLACRGTPSATFELDVTSAIATKAVWYEIGVFPGGCPAPVQLLGGIPQEGTVGRVAFAASATTPPGLGQLANASYGIAAVALASDCSVIGTGCAALGVSGGGTIAVSLAAVPGAPAGACEAGSTCAEGACVPSGDAADGTLVSCSLSLVGAGPLADPLAPDGTLLSAPAIASTPDGFLLAYREVDPNQGNARLTTLAIDTHGAASPAVQTAQPGTCTASPPTDATALAFSGSHGTIVLSRPACPAGGDGGTSAGGVDLFGIDGAGHVMQMAFSGQTGLDVTLGQAHALAYTPAGLLLAYTNQATQASFAAAVTGVDLVTSPPPIPFAGFSGSASETAAYVVGASTGTGLLALGSSAGDGGTSSGLSASFATLALDAGDASSPVGSAFPAAWASAGGVGSRLLVASNGPSVRQSIEWTTFDVGTPGAAGAGTFAPASGGKVAFADVTLHQDHAFFAAEVGQDISLFAFEKVSTFPLQLREVPFSTIPIIPIGALRDGLVAIAASDTQVAVVWGTGATLGADDPVGGYAVFTCAP